MSPPPPPHDSSQMRAVGVSTAVVDEAEASIAGIVQSALQAERDTGVPVSEAFVERVLAAVNDPKFGIRRPLLALAWAEYMDGRASAIGERPTPVVPRPPN